jgi:hypothetical protein
MRNLPVPVADDDIDQMFDYADTDKDGRLSYKEFQVSLIRRQDKLNHDEQKQHVVVVVVVRSSVDDKNKLSFKLRLS